MLSNVPAASLSAVRAALPNSAALSDPQKASLKTLLATPKYTGKTPVQQVQLLNLAYSEANPDAQARVPIVSMTQAQFAALLSELLVSVAALPDSNPAKAQIMAAYQAQMPVVSILPTISLTAPAVEAMFMLLEAAGVVTSQQIAAYTTQPDSNWKSSVIVTDAGNIAGSGALLEVSDVVSALAS